MSLGHNELAWDLCSLIIAKNSRVPRGRLNIKIPSYQYMDSDYKDKTVSRSSHLYNGTHISGKTVYWNETQKRVVVKSHDDVIKWKHFPRYWPFVRGSHRSPVNSPHKGQWRGALMCSLICARINGWVNNREAGDLRRYPAHCDVIVMFMEFLYRYKILLYQTLWSSGVPEKCISPPKGWVEWVVWGWVVWLQCRLLNSGSHDKSRW